jgi:hypothetical protein
MLAAMRSMREGAGSRPKSSRGSLLATLTGRLLSFTLARPGTAALTVLFGGLGGAVAVNALWLQSARHPAPLFHQAALEPQRSAASPLRKPLNTDPVAAQGGGDAATMLPPVRPAELGRIPDANPTVAAGASKLPAAKRPAKDPLADLITPAPTPPAKPAAKAQPVDKVAVRSSNDALAALIERSTKGR